MRALAKKHVDPEDKTPDAATGLQHGRRGIQTNP